VSADRPTIVLPVGPMLVGHFKGEVLGACTDCRRLWGEFRGGRISGEIPGVSLDDGVLAVDGQIRFEVFDGLISFGNLGIERPFGVLPSLARTLRSRISTWNS
jgi:hypothetical protein